MSYVRTPEFAFRFSLQPEADRCGAINLWRECRPAWAVWMYDRLGLMFPEPLYGVATREEFALYCAGNERERLRHHVLLFGVPIALLLAWGYPLADVCDEWYSGYAHDANFDRQTVNSALHLLATGEWLPLVDYRVFIRAEIARNDGVTAAHMGVLNEAEIERSLRSSTGWQWLYERVLRPLPRAVRGATVTMGAAQ